MRNQLPRPLGALHKEPISVSPHPETGKAEMVRDVSEQGRRAGATSVSDAVDTSVVPRDMLYRRPQKLLPLRDGWICTGN